MKQEINQRKCPSYKIFNLF